jgi:hypothetical protein
MNLILPVSTALLLSLLSSNTLADQFNKWGDAGSWQIFVDTSVGNGCLIEKVFEDGSRMRMGHLPERNGAYLSVVNKSWTHIEKSKVVVVNFDLDGVVFGGDVEYIVEGDWRGGYAFFNNPALVDEFAKKNSMTITGPSNQPVSYSLKGTTAALSALHDCRKKNDS